MKIPATQPQTDDVTALPHHAVVPFDGPPRRRAAQKDLAMIGQAAGRVFADPNLHCAVLDTPGHTGKSLARFQRFLQAAVSHGATHFVSPLGEAQGERAQLKGAALLRALETGRDPFRDTFDPPSLVSEYIRIAMAKRLGLTISLRPEAGSAETPSGIPELLRRARAINRRPVVTSLPPHETAELLKVAHADWGQGKVAAVTLAPD